jgi:hypothetical protein
MMSPIGQPNNLAALAVGGVPNRGGQGGGRREVAGRGEAAIGRDRIVFQAFAERVNAFPSAADPKQADDSLIGLGEVPLKRPL